MGHQIGSEPTRGESGVLLYYHRSGQRKGEQRCNRRLNDRAATPFPALQQGGQPAETEQRNGKQGMHLMEASVRPDDFRAEIVHAEKEQTGEGT